MPRQDAVAEAGREAFDLRFDGRRHVDRGAVRHVAVRPDGVLTGRGAGLIKQALLGHERIGLFRHLAVPDQPLACARSRPE